MFHGFISSTKNVTSKLIKQIVLLVFADSDRCKVLEIFYHLEMNNWGHVHLHSTCKLLLFANYLHA